MLDNYIYTKTLSVSIPLNVLEQHLDSSILELIYKELNINSLTQAYLSIDNLNNSLSFCSLTISNEKGIEK